MPFTLLPRFADSRDIVLLVVLTLEREFYFGSIDFGGYVSFLLYFLPAFFEWECTEMNAKEECKLSVYGRIWENRLSACPTNVFQQSGFNCFLGRKLIQTVLWAHSVGSRGG